MAETVKQFIERARSEGVADEKIIGVLGKLGVRDNPALINQPFEIVKRTALLRETESAGLPTLGIKRVAAQPEFPETVTEKFIPPSPEEIAEARPLQRAKISGEPLPAPEVSETALRSAQEAVLQGFKTREEKEAEIEKARRELPTVSESAGALAKIVTTIPVGAVGVAKGALTEIGEEVITPAFARRKAMPAIPETFYATEEDLKQRLGEPIYKALATDVADNVLGLASLGSEVFGTFITTEETQRSLDVFLENRLKRAEDFGRTLAGGLVGGSAAIVKSFVTHPIDTLRARPVTTLLTILPVLKGAKRTQIYSKLSNASKSAVDKLSSVYRDLPLPEMIRPETIASKLGLDAQIPEHFAAIKRWTSDALAQPDATASAVLEEIINNPRKAGAEVRAIIDELARELQAGRLGPEDIFKPEEPVPTKPKPFRGPGGKFVKAPEQHPAEPQFIARPELRPSPEAPEPRQMQPISSEEVPIIELPERPAVPGAEISAADLQQTNTSLSADAAKLLEDANNITYDGVQKGFGHSFTDNMTHSSFVVKPGESVPGKLARVRERFQVSEKLGEDAAQKAADARFLEAQIALQEGRLKTLEAREVELDAADAELETRSREIQDFRTNNKKEFLRVGGEGAIEELERQREKLSPAQDEVAESINIEMERLFELYEKAPKLAPKIAEETKVIGRVGKIILSPKELVDLAITRRFSGESEFLKKLSTLKMSVADFEEQLIAKHQDPDFSRALNYRIWKANRPAQLAKRAQVAEGIGKEPAANIDEAVSDLTPLADRPEYVASKSAGILKQTFDKIVRDAKPLLEAAKMREAALKDVISEMPADQIADHQASVSSADRAVFRKLEEAYQVTQELPKGFEFPMFSSADAELLQRAIAGGEKSIEIATKAFEDLEKASDVIKKSPDWRTDLNNANVAILEKERALDFLKAELAKISGKPTSPSIGAMRAKPPEYPEEGILAQAERARITEKIIPQEAFEQERVVSREVSDVPDSLVQTLLVKPEYEALVARLQEIGDKLYSRRRQLVQHVLSASELKLPVGELQNQIRRIVTSVLRDQSTQLLRSPKLLRAVMKQAVKDIEAAAAAETPGLGKLDVALIRTKLEKNFRMMAENTLLERPLDFAIEDPVVGMATPLHTLFDSFADVVRRNPEMMKEVRAQALRKLGEKLSADVERVKLKEGLKAEGARFYDDAKYPAAKKISMPLEEYAQNIVRGVVARGEYIPQYLRHWDNTQLLNLIRGKFGDFIDLAMKANPELRFKQATSRLQRFVNQLEYSYEDINPEVRAKISGRPTSATKGFNSSLEWEFKSKAAAIDASDIFSKFTRSMKANLTARNIPTHVNNFMSNVFLLAMQRGQSPVEVLASLGKTFETWRAFKSGALENSNPALHQTIKNLQANGLIDSTMIEAEIGGMNMKGITGQFSEKLEKLIDVPDKQLLNLYRWGDNLGKLDVALRNTDSINASINKLAEGEWIQLDLSNRRSVWLIKTGPDEFVVNKLRAPKESTTPEVLDNFVEQTRSGNIPGVARDAFEPVTPELMQRFIAEAAGKPALDIFFDYSDVPNFTKFVRSLPIIGIVSPFQSYFVRSMDIPGLKKGLLSRLIYDDARIIPKSNNAAIQASARNASVALGMRRLATLSAFRAEVLEQDEAREIFKRLPKEVGQILIQQMTNPKYIGFRSFDSSNFADATETVFRVATGIGLPDLAEFDPKVLYAPGDNPSPETLARRKLFVKNASGQIWDMADVLRFVGVAGGPLMEFITRINEGSKRLDDISLRELFARFGGLLIGGEAARVFDVAQAAYDQTSTASTRAWALDEDKQVSEEMLRWAIRRLTGLGSQVVEGEQQRQEYLKKLQTAFTNTLSSELRKRIENAEMLGDRQTARALGLQKKFFDRIIDSEMKNIDRYQRDVLEKFLGTQ